MQTFLPYPDFRKSLEYLDNRRLNCQRKEARQIIGIIECGPYQSWSENFKRWMPCLEEHHKNQDPENNWETRKTPWYNHPACVMWRENLDALKAYYTSCHYECINRGIKSDKFEPADFKSGFEYPWWLGVEELHYSHKCNLVRKDSKYYEPKFALNWAEASDIVYLWPLPNKTFRVGNTKEIFKPVAITDDK